MARAQQGWQWPGPGSEDSHYILVAQGVLTTQPTVGSLCFMLRAQSGVAVSAKPVSESSESLSASLELCFRFSTVVT